MPDKPPCSRCGCPEKKHCAGKQKHADAYKANREVVTVCEGRHCLSPLCFCWKYVPPGVPYTMLPGGLGSPRTEPFAA